MVNGMSNKPKTNVYVDGFNLYYAIRRYRPCCKWLDLSALCQRVLTGYDIHRIRYFTARIQTRSGEQEPGRRQLVYLRALRTIPNLTIHEGRFLTSEKWSVLVNRPDNSIMEMPGILEYHKANGVPMAYVIKVEEKGSDVNLATHLLLDAFHHDFEAAVVISNDSDLVEPVRVVQREFKVPVGVLNPHRSTSFALQQAATFYRPLRQGPMHASQFPPVLRVGKGTVRQPEKWKT
ncbi:MAG TPA: NYN domain-containing protein [Ktedonobacterales bacterium]|nr:NYN domain-containing protein [Ktedonobacterales bacterium]